MKKKIKGDFFLYSANRLHDGKVVYFNKKGVWKENYKEAMIIKFSDIEKYETIVSNDEKCCLIIGPYLIELNKDGKIKKLREQIREKGFNPKLTDV